MEETVMSPGAQAPEPEEKGKRNMTIAIVAGVVALCCCCFSAFAAWWLFNNGDALLEQLG